jgi:hypothetical protein
MSEDKLIGIDTGNKDGLIGPMITAKVIIKGNFFRENPYLIFKNTMTAAEIQSNVDRSMRWVEDSYVGKTSVDLLNNSPNNDVSEVRSIIESLNQTKAFWDYKINIHTNMDVDKFKELFLQLMPMNLKHKRLVLDKWNITNDQDKLLKLAEHYALYNLKMEIDDIKAVWGDFGTGLADDPKTMEFININKECTHIRKVV